MQRITYTLFIIAACIISAINGNAANHQGPTGTAADSVLISGFNPEEDLVIVGSDTISILLPERNLGRYDRGLFNYLFIPKGQWAFGLTASYGEFNSEDVEVLSVIKDFNFKG